MFDLFWFFFQKVYSNSFVFLSKGFFQEGLFFFTRGVFSVYFFLEKKRCCLFFKGVAFAKGLSFSKVFFYILFSKCFLSKVFFLIFCFFRRMFSKGRFFSNSSSFRNVFLKSFCFH